MDSETLQFPSEEGVICLMFLSFFWTFAFIYFDSLLYRYQAPSLRFKTHSQHTPLQHLKYLLSNGLPRARISPFPGKTQAS